MASSSRNDGVTHTREWKDAEGNTFEKTTRSHIIAEFYVRHNYYPQDVDSAALTHYLNGRTPQEILERPKRAASRTPASDQNADDDDLLPDPQPRRKRQKTPAHRRNSASDSNPAVPAASSQTLQQGDNNMTAVLEALARSQELMLNVVERLGPTSAPLPQPERPQLSGEEQSRCQSIQSLFPGVAPEHITAILKHQFNPRLLARLASSDAADNEPEERLWFMDNVSGKLASKENKSLKEFKSLRQWSMGFTIFLSIFTELHGLNRTVGAMLRFQHDVHRANETYEWKECLNMAISWHEQRRRHAIDDPAAWWPIPQAHRDHYLRTVRPATKQKPSNQSKKPGGYCYAFLSGSCNRTNCTYKHLTQAEVNKLQRPLADRISKPST